MLTVHRDFLLLLFFVSSLSSFPSDSIKIVRVLIEAQKSRPIIRDEKMEEKKNSMTSGLERFLSLRACNLERDPGIDISSRFDGDGEGEGKNKWEGNSSFSRKNITRN